MKRFQAAFAFFVLLLKNHMVENSMNVIELWFSRKRRQTENIERIEANQHVRPDQHSSTSGVGHPYYVFT
jgi:hypothetical protein